MGIVWSHGLGGPGIKSIKPWAQENLTGLNSYNFVDFVGLALIGKDIVLRFIIECSSLRDFGP
jgi:hypothetical protein